MASYRKWYCSCRGKPLELSTVETLKMNLWKRSVSDAARHPHLIPGHTISYRDVETWED